MNKRLKIAQIGHLNCSICVVYTVGCFTPYSKGTFNTLDVICVPIFTRFPDRPNRKKGAQEDRDEEVCLPSELRDIV